MAESKSRIAELEAKVDEIRKDSEAASKRNTLALESITKVSHPGTVPLLLFYFFHPPMPLGCSCDRGMQVSAEETNRLRDTLTTTNQQSEERFSAMAKEVEQLLQKLNEAELALAQQQKKSLHEMKVHLVGGC